MWVGWVLVLAAALAGLGGAARDYARDRRRSLGRVTGTQIDGYGEREAER